MGILSGYKRFKKYLRTGEGYKLCSEWTKSDSVEMTDGSTLQESMDSIVSDVENTQNNVTDVHNELMTSLGGMTFGVDAAGRYGYIKAGADTVTPFKSHANVIHFNPTWVITSGPSSTDGSVSVNGSTITILNHKSGSNVAFPITFRSVEKYDFKGCIGIAFTANINAHGSTYNNRCSLTVNGNDVSAQITASQLGPIQHYFFYLNEELRPGDGDGYIYGMVNSVVHTTGFAASHGDITINDWYLIT